MIIRKMTDLATRDDRIPPPPKLSFLSLALIFTTLGCIGMSAAFGVQIIANDLLERQLAAAKLAAEFPDYRSQRDDWDCTVLRNERYVVCKLPAHAMRFEAYVNVHKGCC